MARRETDGPKHRRPTSFDHTFQRAFAASLNYCTFSAAAIKVSPTDNVDLFRDIHTLLTT